MFPIQDGPKTNVDGELPEVRVYQIDSLDRCYRLYSPSRASLAVRRSNVVVRPTDVPSARELRWVHTSYLLFCSKIYFCSICLLQLRQRYSMSQQGLLYLVTIVHLAGITILKH